VGKYLMMREVEGHVFIVFLLEKKAESEYHARDGWRIQGEENCTRVRLFTSSSQASSALDQLPFLLLFVFVLFFLFSIILL